MQIYVLIGTFIISFFIDVYLSIKNKKIRIFSLSNWGIILWIVLLGIIEIPIHSWNTKEWGNTFGIIIKIPWVISPLIIFTITRLKLYHEIQKTSNSYVDIFTYFKYKRGSR